MNNLSKKRVSSATKNLKNSKKFFSIMAMFLLLTTTVSSVVSSQSDLLNQIKNNLEIQNTSDKPVIKIIKYSSIKERLLLLKEKIRNLIEKITQIKNRLSTFLKDETDETNDYSSKNIRPLKLPILRSFEKFLRLKLLNLTIMFYTNYSGIEKQIAIKFLQEKKIDVNNDSKNDIKVKLGLSFSIERFLHFSINFKYFITRLSDFPDTQAHFEAYTELYFPGLLSLRQRGDRIRFGYESPEGEEVPSSCQIIYRYLPKIINLRKKPEHRIEINPGKNNGNSKLILLLGYTNFNNNKTVISELNSRIIYNPAVKSTVSIGGNGILGGSTFEFAREYSGESQVDMYCSFEKNNKTTIGYVKDLPKKVTFTINFGRDGNIKFNTYNQAPSEIGLCNDFYNPDSKIYFTNLLSKAELNWNIRAVIQQKVDLSFYTDSSGTSLKGELKSIKNSTINFNIFSKENLDCEMSLDLKNGHFVFKRNKVDISINLLFNGSNSSLDFSTNISSFCDEPFEIFFDKLKNGNVEVLFSGSYLEVSDLNFIFLKSASNNTKGEDELTLTYNNQDQPVVLEPFLTIKLSSLRLSARDFIKLKSDNETKEVNLSAGGNGSVKLNDIIIKCNLLEIQSGLFEVESDHFYGSAINLSLNLSDIKNTTVESVALENAISKFIIEGLSFKLNFKEIFNLTEFRADFSGCGALYLTYNKSSVNITGIINGPGLFEIEVLNINLSSNTSSIILLKLEDFSMSGPTTFFIYGYLGFNGSNISDFSFNGGVGSGWHIGKFYLNAFGIPIIEVINLNGEGQISAGLEKSQNAGLFDIIISLAGNWDWEKVYFVPLSEGERPGIHCGSFSGNFNLRIHIPNLNELLIGYLSGTVYSNTKLDQFKLDGSVWSISAVSLQMKPGDFYISWDISNSSNVHLLLDNSGTIDLEFDTFLIENKNSGESFSFRSREVSVPHLEMITDINGGGNGYLFLDTNNQYCNYEITKSELIKINKTFRAENFNISWNFSGGLFNIIDIEGFIEFGKTFEILVFINGQWRVLISINEPVAEFTWSPSQPGINETIQFDGSESYFSSPITRYDWKWYSTDVWHNNLGPYPTHSYNLDGDYRVSLRIWSGLKHSTCTKIVNVGGSRMNVNIIYENETLYEGSPFEIIVTDMENNNTPLSDVLVTYTQQDCNGIWQNTTNITNSDGITGFIAFDVPQDCNINYSDAKAFVSKSGYPDAESRWFQVHDITSDMYENTKVKIIQ